MWLFYVIQVHKRFPIWWQWSNALVRMISNEAIYCVCAAAGLFVLADYFTNSFCRKAVAQWASVLLESAKFYVLCCPVTQGHFVSKMFAMYTISNFTFIRYLQVDNYMMDKTPFGLD